MKQALPWIIASVLLGSLGQVMLKISSNRLGSVTLGKVPLPVILLRLASLPTLWIGLILFGTSMILWVRVLHTAPLGLAYPMVSMGYIVVLVLSVILFGEHISLQQVFGIVAIILGVSLIAG